MSKFLAYQISEKDGGGFEGGLIEGTIGDFPEGEVLIEVHYS